ncbi:MAG: YbaN family protein [Angelakisella sp.]|nr:YbaN family protein [Angelakisella sp.]
MNPKRKYNNWGKPSEKDPVFILGYIGMVFGAVGAVVPMLPAFPFLMLAAFCFARSSEKLDKWFNNSKLYKDNLEDYVAGRGMTKKAKVRIMVTVNLLMSTGFMMVDAVPVGRAVLTCVWVFHILYFLFGIKTIPASKETVKA